MSDMRNLYHGLIRDAYRQGALFGGAIGFIAGAVFVLAVAFAIRFAVENGYVVLPS